MMSSTVMPVQSPFMSSFSTAGFAKPSMVSAVMASSRACVSALPAGLAPAPTAPTLSASSITMRCAVLRRYGVAQLVHGQRRQHHAGGLVAHSVDVYQYAEHLALRHLGEAEQLVGVFAHHQVGVELGLAAFGAPQRLVGVERYLQQVAHPAAVDDGLRGFE